MEAEAATNRRRAMVEEGSAARLRDSVAGRGWWQMAAWPAVASRGLSWFWWRRREEGEYA
jgi:hypothetical protein